MTRKLSYTTYFLSKRLSDTCWTTRADFLLERQQLASRENPPCKSKGEATYEIGAADQTE